MKHKTWFRLVVKAIGVLLIGISLPGIGQFVGFVLYMLTDFGRTTFSSNEFRWMQTMYYAGALMQCLLGVYLFFGGQWIVNRCIPSNRSYCPECGYNLSNARGARCSECGVTLPADILPIAPPEDAGPPRD
jgi:hypothetical protein